MIGLPGGTRIRIAAGVTDVRKGYSTLLGDQGDQSLFRHVVRNYG